MNLPLGTLQTSLAGASVSNPRLDIFGFWLEKQKWTLSQKQQLSPNPMLIALVKCRLLLLIILKRYGTYNLCDPF